MEKNTPDHRWQSLCKAIDAQTEPADDFLKMIYRGFKNKKIGDTIKEALDLIRNDRYREELIIFFLSGASCNDVSRSLNIPKAQLEVFQKLILDMSAFKHKLHLREFIQEFKKSLTDPELVNLLEVGLLLGPDAIEYHFQHGRESINFLHTDLADKLLLVTFYKGIIARGASIDSPEAREALRWSQAYFKNVNVREHLSKDKNREETEALALIEAFRSSKTPDEANIDVSNILHSKNVN